MEFSDVRGINRHKEDTEKGIQNVTYVERYIYINIWLEKT